MERVRSSVPVGAAGRLQLRRAASVLTSLAAIMGLGLAGGPSAVVALEARPCALHRTDVHHSEGLASWNPVYPRPQRSLDALMVFLSFPDWKPLSSPNQLYADYFPATSDFFARASYGKFALQAHPHPRWIEMPMASTGYGIERDWDPAMRTQYLQDAVLAADPKMDFGSYDIVYLIADPDAPGVQADATKVVNFEQPLEVDGGDLRRVVTVFERHPPDRHVLAHETGHVFDLPDLYHRPEGGSGDWDTYVGDWDMMGSQFGLAPDPFAWHKWKLGWLDRWNVACMKAGRATARYTLQPLGAPLEWPGNRDTRLIVVQAGATEVLVLEARTPVGNDVATCTSGVLLYRVRSDAASADGPVEVVDGHPDSVGCRESSVYPPLADAPLGEGESLVAPAGPGEVRVEVGGRTAQGGWEVRITR